jgi:cytochrome c peroxidase
LQRALTRDHAALGSAGDGPDDLERTAREHHILSGNAPYDRSGLARKGASRLRPSGGLALFEDKARYVHCHTGFNFTDEGYHNIGVGMDKENPDLGRYAVTKSEAHRGAFKTPTLRDVARRGPYIHDGSENTLEEVVAFYNQGGRKNPWLSHEIQPLNLTAREQTDLVAFLQALAGEIVPQVSSPPPFL